MSHLLCIQHLFVIVNNSNPLVIHFIYLFQTKHFIFRYHVQLNEKIESYYVSDGVKCTSCPSI